MVKFAKFNAGAANGTADKFLKSQKNTLRTHSLAKIYPKF